MQDGDEESAPQTQPRWLHTYNHTHMLEPNMQDGDEESDPPNTAEVAAVSAGGRVGGSSAGGSSSKDRLVEEPLAVLLAGVLHQVCVCLRVIV
jgi:hypothetical protein